MKEKTSLVFTGDIGFDRYMDGQWNDPELLSQEILDFFGKADHVIANVEGPLVDQETNKTTEGVVQLMHTMNPAATKVLKDIHADIWNICNNHIMDAGEMGVKCTLDEADRFGAKTIGAGMDLTQAAKPLILDEAGGIGMFGVGYQRGCKPAGPEKAGCLNWSDMETIQQVISDIKKTCRWCIVVSHGGEEFTSLPSPYTRDRYIRYLEMGADIIVCHHPHVPMNYEIIRQNAVDTIKDSSTKSGENEADTFGNKKANVEEETLHYGDKAIFYSLGNFIFDTDYQRAQFNTDIGLLLRLDITEDSYTFEPVGLQIERGPEHIVRGPVPRIFTEVDEDEYKLLAPLSAKAFVAATKRQQIYLNKAEYENASEEKWAEHFANPKRSGRVPGEGLDFFIICPLAEEAQKGAWKDSKLEIVKEYILEQM